MPELHVVVVIFVPLSHFYAQRKTQSNSSLCFLTEDQPEVLTTMSSARWTEKEMEIAKQGV